MTLLTLLPSQSEQEGVLAGLRTELEGLLTSQSALGERLDPHDADIEDLKYAQAEHEGGLADLHAIAVLTS